MAIDTTPSSVATSALQAIPFSSLIGGPLNACIEAQALAAKTTWTFIQQVGLDEDPQTKQRKAINVVFQYQRGNEMANLVVPLLTIVPIPYIAIDTIDINFKANISASSSSVNEESSETTFGGELSAHAEFGFGMFKVSADFKANYSSKKDSKATQDSKYSVEYTMDIAVHAGQDSMPAGLAAVLGILRESITSGTIGGKLNASVTSVTLTPGSTNAADKTAVIGASTVNSQNLALKGAGAPDITFEIKGSAPGLTFNSTPVKGTVVGSATSTKMAVKPGDDGIASVTLLADSTFANNAVVTISATIDGTPNSVDVTVNKA
jgi:Protein of unknown function (DUF2589)